MINVSRTTMTAILFANALAAADVPRLIHYQGKLRDAGGAAVTDTVDLRFRLYDDAVAGNSLFDESHSSVFVTNGLFSVLIGSPSGGVPDSALDAGEVWLSVSIGAGEELTPRTRIGTTPHAIKARSAEQLVRPDSLAAAVTVDEVGNVAVGGGTPLHALDVSGAHYSREAVLSWSSNLNVDWDAGNVQSVVLGGNTNVTFSDGRSGGVYHIVLQQDATGGRTVDWPDSIRWPDAAAPTLSTSPDAVDWASFVCSGGVYLGSMSKNHREPGQNTHSIDLERDSSQSLYVADGSQTGLDLAGSMTVEAWIKFESVPVTNQLRVIAAKHNSNNNQQSYIFAYRNDTPGVIGWSVRFSTAGDNGSSTSGELAYGVSAGQWYHVAFVYNNPAGSVQIFVNGTSAGTIGGQATGAIFNSTSAFRIGGADMSGMNWDGLIDDVRVWSGIRTQGQIAANMNAELTGSEPNVQGCWKLNNGLQDASPNGNHLSNDGGAVFSTDIPF